MAESRSAASGGEGGVDELEFSVLSVRDLYSYTIPSFPAIRMELQHAVVKSWPGSKHDTMDVFLRVRTGLPSTERHYPATLVMTNGCCVPEEEFSREIDTTGLHLVHSETDVSVFVLYVWFWEDLSSGESSDEPSSGPEEDAEEEYGNSPTVCQIPEITHIVIFKCIGANRDFQHQTVLRTVRDALRRQEIVEVKLLLEPANPYDSDAVAFVCFIENKWQRIGYVVREILHEVHEALSKEILSVKIAWVQYLLQWVHSGPGYYAGVNVSRRGEWSRAVQLAASTKKHQ